MEFEKRYDGHTEEKKIQQFWEEEGIYDFHPDASRPVYSIDTPPPTVNGSLHVGHIFSYTQAEMIARYRRMQGYNVYYPFGFDDNGLPSERLVEKEYNIRAMDIPRSEFCEKCVETTQRYEEQFLELWKSMGFSCDWNLQYHSISDKAQKISQQSFIELAKEGHAYAKESPVLWCTECQTSIAQAELETKEMESYFHYIPFQTEGGELLIATTRPELLYGVVCIFINPQDERYQHLIGQTAAVPLYGFEVPILADEKVGIDKGTGAVMCATYGDATDVEWVEEYSLPYKKVILPDGSINPEVPFIGGLKVRAARKETVRLLEEQGLLLKSEKLTHMVAVHERCGTEVEIIPSRQWYIDVLSKREEYKRAGDEINWFPPQMKKRYTTWVENLKWDWCISRQRYFGVPFPVWYCAKCQKPHFADIDSLPVNPLETPYIGTCECGSTEFIPEKAVLDTWATSSLTPIINRETAKEHGIEENFMPMSMRTQAHEIIRTWAFYTIVKSLYHTGNIPWKDVMVCGFVLAKPGEKISKSKGNSKLTPQALVETYTADAIRYWAAGSRLGTDTFFDQEEMRDSSKRFLTKLWNSSKFVLSHLTDYDPEHEVELKPIDRFMMERTKETIREVSQYLDAYEIGLARHAIDDLFWKDFCDYYIEIVKERLYQPEVHGIEERRSAQYAACHCLLSILKLYAVYVPHITEAIYQRGFRELIGSTSIHQLVWDKELDTDKELLEFGGECKAALGEIRRYKSENSLSMKDQVESMTFYGKKEHEPWFWETFKDLRACSHAKDIRFEPTD